MFDLFKKTDKTDLLLTLAKRAGNLVLSSRVSGFSVSQKEDLTPVTDVDREANFLIEEGLSAAFPDIPIVSEENPQQHRIPSKPKTFFLVDPIDGTREFVEGLSDFTINIASVENGIVQEGVVFAPAFGMLFWGATSLGAFEGKIRGEGCEWSPLSCSTPAPHRTRRTVVLSRFSRTRCRREYPDWLRETDEVVRMGSSLKFCWIARGSADVYPRFGKTMEWDTAAGHAVLKAAGGGVFLEDGSELSYGKWRYGLTNDPFCAIRSQIFTFDRDPV